MKPLNTNSLRNALGSHEAGAHPDPDVLNAFVEGSLLANERRNVMEHLSACDHCRAAVALACDAAPASAVETAPARKMRPSLRIAVPAFAAAAAVAATLLVVHRTALRSERVTVVADKRPANQKPTSSATGAPKRSASPAVAPPHEPAANGKSADTVATLQAQTSPQPAKIPSVPPAITAEQAEVSPSEAQLAVAPAPIPQPANAQSEFRPSRAESGPPQVKLRDKSAADVEEGLTSGAFANTAATQALAKTSELSISRPHWRINKQGEPQRAFGSGPWQTVLPTGASPMRVLATAGTDVWAGGENAQVYHSSDDGQSWSKINLPEVNGTAHSIAHIQIDSPLEITIRASDGTTWVTSNGGASWK